MNALILQLQKTHSMKKAILLPVLITNIYISAQYTGINNTNPSVTLDIKGNPTNTTVLDGIMPPKITGELP